MSTRLPVAIVALSLAVTGACTSASQIRRQALEDADVVDRELDILYECGLEQAARLDLEIAHRDSAARVYQTHWQAADGASVSAERWRLTVLVRTHPRFGPGADAVVTRDRWVGSDETRDLQGPTLPSPGPEDTGWRRAAGSTPEDDATTRATAGGIRECWQRTSTLAH